MLPFLRLVRAGALFSPAADVLAGAALWHADKAGSGPLWSTDLVRGMLASVLVYAAGMALNDHADRAEDARQRPERPIPSGQIAPHVALLFGLGLLAAGVLVAPTPLPWVALGLGVVAYDYLLKKRLPLAALGMGLLRAGNLLSGAILLHLQVGGDGDLSSRTVMLAALAYFAYIFAVTLLGAFEDDPKVPARAVEGVQSVPPIVAVLALMTVPERTALWIGLALAVVFLRSTRAHRGQWDKTRIRAAMTWLLLGTMLYTALLTVGAGRWAEGLGIAVAVLPARWISRRIAWT